MLLQVISGRFCGPSTWKPPLRPRRNGWKNKASRCRSRNWLPTQQLQTAGIKPAARIPLILPDGYGLKPHHPFTSNPTPLHFHKRLKLFPGVFLNFSKQGFSSLSIGAPGATVNIPVAIQGWTRTTVGLPGTGLSYSQEASRKRRSPARISSACPCLAAAASMITSGQASMTDD